MKADINYWAQMAMNCIAMGGLLLIIAIGLNIIYGISRIINIAHGSLYAMGAYFGYSIVNLGADFFLALVISPFITAFIGILIERSIISPIRRRPMLYSLILTYGLMVFLDGLFKYFWGPQIRFVPLPSILDRTINIAGIQYPFYRLFILLSTLGIMVFLALMLSKTKIGMIMRAASTIPEMVSALGINMNLVHVFVFGLGCFLASLGGIIAAPLLTVYPMMGSEMLINCFVVLVIGGLGSIKGVSIAAFLVGTAQTLGYVFITDYAMVVVFVMMAGILSFFPRGILGEGKFE